MMEILEVGIGTSLPGTKKKALVTDELVVGSMCAFNSSIYGWCVQEMHISQWDLSDSNNDRRTIIMFIQ